MTQIVIVYIYGPNNAGDMALNCGAVDVLQSLGDVRIVGISRFSEHHPGYSATVRYMRSAYSSVGMLPFPVDYDRHSQSLIRQAIGFLKGSLLFFPSIDCPLTGDNAVLKAIRSADYVVFNGGNLLFSRSLKDNLRLRGILYPIACAKAFDKPYGFLPQSIPDLANRAGRETIESFLREARFCFFRESVSSRTVELGGSSQCVFPDLAFFIQRTDHEAAMSILASSKLRIGEFVPVVLRASSLGDQNELPDRDRRETTELVGDLFLKLRAMGLQPVLVVQTLQDKRISEASARQGRYLGVEVPIIEELNPLVLRGIYQRAYCTIAFRLHAAILSLSAGTPAIGIYRTAWGSKMPGTFDDLGLRRLCFDFRDLRHNQLLDIDELIAFSRKALMDVAKRIDHERLRMRECLANAMNLQNLSP
ncbi:MAG: polysaccharide pyruvyl transferase family protein [Firmicutes bacterium]|jgi:polysaccharide pyruvyl transferase WcaK-like protein|nr:polysaccharide pyruvyl transferase family protein [Bacillota bacterium]MDH7496245.1 polysaccharide pyruvyl transferase family protein [Bacillota bacterium]